MNEKPTAPNIINTKTTCVKGAGIFDQSITSVHREIIRLRSNRSPLTFSAPVELYSHGNVRVPGVWMDFNIQTLDSWKQSILNNTVLVPISDEILK